MADIPFHKNVNSFRKLSHIGTRSTKMGCCQSPENSEIVQTKIVSPSAKDTFGTNTEVNIDKLLVTREDNRYQSLRCGHNLRFVGDISLLTQIYVCTTTREVHAVFQKILSTHGLSKEISIRGGGHCYEGFVTLGKNIIIDISSVKHRHVSLHHDNKEYYAIGSGNTNWEGVKYLFKKHGVCLPGGSCYSVGFGGHIVGGGYGILSRKYGLTVDYLAGVELVYTQNGKTAKCKQFFDTFESKNNIINDDGINITYGNEIKENKQNEEDEQINISDKDVVWAHKGGGGGNFGVITTYYFDNLPKAPAKVLCITLDWTWDQMRGSKLRRKDKDGFDYGYEPFRLFMTRFGQFWIDHVDYRDGVKQEGINKDNKYIWFDDKLNYNDMFSELKIFTNYNNNGQICVNVQWAIDESNDNVSYISTVKDAIKHFYAYLVQSDIDKDKAKHADISNININGEELVIEEYPFLVATQAMGGNGKSECFKNKSCYMLDGFTDHEVNTIIKYNNRKRFIDFGDKNCKGIYSFLQVDSYGGIINATKPHETAVSHRSSVMKLQYQIHWPKQTLTGSGAGVGGEDYSIACLKWIREFYMTMYDECKYKEPWDYNGNKHVDGCYVNYCDIDLKDWPTLYYGQRNYAKLQRVQRYLNPKKVFSHQQSIGKFDGIK